MARKPSPRKMKLAHIEECFQRLAARLPDPKTELAYSSPYTLLVAVVLSAQATDVGVNRATRGLYAAADTPQAMVALGVDGIAHHIRTVGLFNTKAKNVHRLSQILIDEHDGEVPADRAALEALPGVGRKTANVVLNEALENRPSPSTPIFSGSATAPAWPPARRRTRSRQSLFAAFRKPGRRVRITG